VPEQITKHPDVTLQVLQGAGGRCGPGVPKNILTQCPSERFCAFSSGEVCVYGLDQIPQMTQITSAELARVVCPGARSSDTGALGMAWPDAGPLGLTLALGIVIGAVARRAGRR
jgi:hypothetical protein